MGRPRRLYQVVGIPGSRLWPGHLPASGLDTPLQDRRRLPATAARADAILRNGDRLLRPQSSSQQLPLVAGGASRILQVLRKIAGNMPPASSASGRTRDPSPPP